ncbi:cyclic AMP-responsive element-binding protein 1-like isoform X2 [Amphiura filiformis]|uniref:cyclic AMP-responsive element-binding protein 1-like isoform X2 n=1 Tax=Amphiura filiformis TaxID=82378 RepID=UPI003B21ABEB
MEEEPNANSSNNSNITEDKQVIVTQGGVPVSMVMTAIPNQPVQVQSVIQAANQPSVIQATPIQTMQVQVQEVDGDGQPVQLTLHDPEVERKKRQEILSRRPSYRKILNDLSSDAPGVPKIEEEPSESGDDSNDQTTPTTITIAGTTFTNFPAVVAGGGATIAIANPADVQGLHTLTMTNAGGPAAGTIVQSIQTQDGTQQFFVPTASGDVQAYQIRPATSLPQGVVMAAPATIQTQQQLAEEASRKRELRLMKNREAAMECRRKKKEYIKCLENRVAVLENQNKTLIEELKSLKELYCHKSE